MDVAEWMLVAILSLTLFVFLIIGIILMVKLLGLTDEAKKVVIKSQDIAGNASDVVANVKGLTSVGGTVEMFVEKYINPKLKAKVKERKEDGGEKRK